MGTSPASDTPKLKLLAFTSKSCGACAGMKRAKSLENFAKKHPNVGLEYVDTEDGESEDEDTENTGGAARADDYEVESLPTLVLVSEASGSEVELARFEGAPPFGTLDKLYDKALSKLRAKR